MRRRPSSLGRDALPKSGTSALPARACGFACLWETLAKHRVCAGFRPCGWHHQGLGLGLGDASAGLGLHHQDFLPKSLSTHEALFFRRCRRDVSEAHFGAKRCRACRRCWVLTLENAVNKVAEPWAAPAGVLRGPCFFPVGFRAFWRARARPRPQNAAIHGVLLHFRFRAGLRAVLFGLLFLGPLARARATPCQPSGLGPGWGPESWHPRHHLGLGQPYHITAQDTFLIQKT